MKRTVVLLVRNNPKLEEIIDGARVCLREAPVFLQKLKEEQKTQLKEKFVRLNNFYMRIIGIEEVRRAQDKVMLLQDELSKTREKRREVERQLNEVNSSRSDLQNEMSKIDRNVHFERFIELREQETEIFKMVQPLQKVYQQYDQVEKELFVSLTNSIRDAHEKERLQMEYSKYISFILSLTGSFLAFAYGSLRKEDLKRYIDRTQERNNEHLEQMMENSKVTMAEVQNTLLELRQHSKTMIDEVQSSLVELQQLQLNTPQNVSLPLNVIESDIRVNYWPHLCLGAVALLLVSSFLR